MAVQQTKVTVNIRDDLLEDVKRIATHDNKTVTEVINEALRLRALAEDKKLFVGNDHTVSQILL